jgi:hypothetical protein
VDLRVDNAGKQGESFGVNDSSVRLAIEFWGDASNFIAANFDIGDRERTVGVKDASAANQEGRGRNGHCTKD